jgi:hypothetical protein
MERLLDLGLIACLHQSVQSGHNQWAMSDKGRKKTASLRKNDGLDMDFFAENACPTPRGIVDSLTILRKCEKPFATEELATRLDLLFLPFLSGIETEEQRVSRLAAALELAADRLPSGYEIVYRHIFLKPEDKELGKRREKALAELGESFPSKRDNETPTIKSIEGRLLPLLAEILLDPEFEQALDSEYPKPTDETLSCLFAPTQAFQIISASLSYEIENEDCRKSILHRVHQLESLLPDQRVVGIRYHTRASNPMPVDDGVVMLSKGHTYLGAHPDSQDGAIADWILQFVYLGTRMEPGDRTWVEMRTEFFDEAKSDEHPCVTFTVDHQNIGKIDLAMRLPEDKREATAEYRVIKSPHSNSVVVDAGPLAVTKDGWVRVAFTDLEVGLQYGIFWPEFDLYK